MFTFLSVYISYITLYDVLPRKIKNITEKNTETKREKQAL